MRGCAIPLATPPVRFKITQQDARTPLYAFPAGKDRRREEARFPTTRAAF